MYEYIVDQDQSEEQTGRLNCLPFHGMFSSKYYDQLVYEYSVDQDLPEEQTGRLNCLTFHSMFPLSITTNWCKNKV